jgi:hypothetical protein
MAQGTGYNLDQKFEFSAGLKKSLMTLLVVGVVFLVGLDFVFFEGRLIIILRLLAFFGVWLVSAVPFCLGISKKVYHKVNTMWKSQKGRSVPSCCSRS